MALILFLVAGLGSAGPNIVLLVASAARFGFRRTVPHLLGVASGVAVTSGLTGLGIGALLLARPSLTLTLQIAACAWILWMAWGLWRAAAGADAGRDRPFSYAEAVLFQWVNPKVWAVALAASAGYGLGLPPWQEGLRLAAAFAGVNICVCSAWTLGGSALGRLRAHPTQWRLFMRGLAILLGLSAALVFI